MPARIFHDSFNGHQLRHIEERPDGNHLYEDLKNGDRVVCNQFDVAQYPRARLLPPMVYRLTPEQKEAWGKPGSVVVQAAKILFGEKNETGRV